MPSEYSIIDDIKGYEPSEELISKTISRDKWDTEIHYGDLKVTEKSTMGGLISYELELGDYGNIQLNYRLTSRGINKIHLVEALSQGEDFEVWTDIFGDSSQYQEDEWELTNVLEDGKLPEEYQDPVKEFLHDIFWEE